MPVFHFEQRQVRNLVPAALDFHSRINLIAGANACGKTSLLEAIYILGTGKSFRTQRLDQVISHGANELTVFGRAGPAGDIAIGFRKFDDQREIRVNGENQDSTASLARYLPLQVIAPDTHFAFLRQSTHRRGTLDWGLFHVEQDFYRAWSDYRRLLRQRNAALKQRRPVAEFCAWDQALAAEGERIQAWRQDYVAQWNEVLAPLLQRLLGLDGVRLGLRLGWRKGQGLAEVLDEDAARDRESGYTHSGPHRADLELLVDGRDARQEFSQGQWKLAIVALRLAQLAHFHNHTGETCTLLLDDLPAELDQERRARVMTELASLSAQVFVTATTPNEVPLAGFQTTQLFHVEHGRIWPE
jgi:DNA replication and repair protein RecF